jgi:hypothetical protein
MTLEELKERMRLKWEKLAREAEEKHLVEEVKKCAGEEAARKAAEKAKSKANAAKWKATRVPNSKAVPSKETKVNKGKGQAEEPLADSVRVLPILHANGE